MKEFLDELTRLRSRVAVLDGIIAFQHDTTSLCSYVSVLQKEIAEMRSLHINNLMKLGELNRKLAHAELQATYWERKYDRAVGQPKPTLEEIREQERQQFWHQRKGRWFDTHAARPGNRYRRG